MKPRLIILLIIAIELLSFVGHFYPILNTAGFIVIIGATLIASIIKLEYGLYIALTELIIGGMGYLFSFFIGPTPVSIRLGIFLVVMAVWLVKVFQTMSFRPSETSGEISHQSFIERVRSLGFARDDRERGILKWWGLFGLAIIWGILMGVLRKNTFANVFLDANGYLYAAMILPFLWVTYQQHITFKGSKSWIPAFARLAEAKAKRAGMTTVERGAGETILKNFLTIFVIGTAWLAIKTLFAAYLYTHAGYNFFAINIPSFYQWIRDTRVGEITWLPGNLARVFFQGQIYNLVAFFVLFIAVLADQKTSFFPRIAGVRMNKGWIFVLCALNLAVIIIGLSRSFWVGTLCGLFLIFIYIFFKKIDAASLGARLCRLKFVAGRLLVVAVMAIILILTAARLPIPSPSPLDLSEATKSRLEFEKAVSSRWNLWPPLWHAVEKHWFLGSGFGTTVTYISNDPRVRAENPTGSYTTYAFEWGWLDLWLKLGMVGLMLYLGLLGWIIKQLIKKNNAIGLAGTLIIVVLSVVNFFTPYLNHPLGFGILILLTTVIARSAPEADDEAIPLIK